jgi:hypothetical protein
MAKQFDGVVRQIRKASRGDGAVVVGPALTYEDDWGAGIITGGRVTMVVLGGVAAEIDPEFAAHFDTVISIRRAGELSLDEARERRAELIAALKQKFREVHAFDTELAAASFAAGRWPSPKLRDLCRRIEQEQRDGGRAA